MSYILTLVLDDDQLAEILAREHDRPLTAAAVAAEGCGIIRDYGAVLAFRHETTVDLLAPKEAS